MPRRGNYREPNACEVLDKLGAARAAMCPYLPSHPLHANAEAVRKAIDAFAEAATGNPRHYHLPWHKFPL